jgi:tripartite-type tricarboxylate transporter receptor subunit TctC
VKVLLGFYVHKNTPVPIRKILLDACKKIYDDPVFKKRVDELGDEPRFMSPESMRETIKKEEEINLPILKEFGLYVGKWRCATSS